MWIILIIVLFFIVQFFISKNQKSNQIEREGGMRNKYRRLIELIMALHPSTRVIQECSDYLTIRASNSGGIVEMSLIQNAHNLVVKWKTESSIFGLHKMKWEFYEFDNQDQMMNRINIDTTSYLKNVYSAFETNHTYK